MPNQQAYQQFDASGAVQSTTSYLMKRVNEVAGAKNALFNEVIGSVTRRNGYEQVGETIEDGNDGLYGGVYRYDQNYKIVVGINDSNNQYATLRYMDNGGYWTNIITDAAANTRFNCLNSLGEFYVAGKNDADVRQPLTLVKSDLTTTTSYNVLNAPKAEFIAEYQGQLFAINCEVDGVKHPNRAYYSSPPLGYITRVQTAQGGVLTQLRVDSIQYLKPGMQVDIYGANSNAKKVSGLTIVDVTTNTTDGTVRITFNPTSFYVADNDEIWLVNRKGQQTRYWNTDYPNTEAAPFFEIPVAEDSESTPEITAYGKNNGRLFLFTSDSFYKTDGFNLIPVSENVGCVAPESVKNVGKWTIFLHSTGVWGYNDDTGQLQMLSKPIEKYIRAINQSNFKKISAGVVNRVYKLSIGELLPFSSDTTSTSTSSTSTSSTSTSTSSTSTSSTSTSSTSTSTSRTTTSTSSTSSSTSSTSTSTTTGTTTSISTSTSSTSTSTIASTKEVYRLCYDFDSNTWWVETHKREHRFQFKHKMHGYKKGYFIDETGRLFRDETGYSDHNDTIPFEMEWGRDNFGTPLLKNYHSVIVDVDRAESVTLMYSIDGGQFKTLGQVNKNVSQLIFKYNERGHNINYKYVHNDTKQGPVINGQTTYWSPAESIGAAG